MYQRSIHLPQSLPQTEVEPSVIMSQGLMGAKCRTECNCLRNTRLSDTFNIYVLSTSLLQVMGRQRPTRVTHRSRVTLPQRLRNIVRTSGNSPRLCYHNLQGEFINTCVQYFWRKACLVLHWPGISYHFSTRKTRYTKKDLEVSIVTITSEVDFAEILSNKKVAVMDALKETVANIWYAGQISFARWCCS